MQHTKEGTERRAKAHSCPSVQPRDKTRISLGSMILFQIHHYSMNIPDFYFHACMHRSTRIDFHVTRKSCKRCPMASHCCLNSVPTAPPLSFSGLVGLRLSCLQAKAYSPYITTSWDKSPPLTLFLPWLQTSSKPGMYKRERDRGRITKPGPPSSQLHLKGQPINSPGCTQSLL